MLSTSVLCIKKRKKRSYCIANAATVYRPSDDQSKRSNGGAVTMMQITEDTPPDMLAGAMDLTVHLPNGRPVKMSVKRSMPMMDLLMHISTKHNLQLTDYTLQALSMAPSPDQIDRLLPFKPNTPIGLIDTQHIKVLPKTKPIVKQRMAPQPFESTFRLKVHLPRNQLYVTRVSRNVHLEDILKKACEEKVLDPNKYALHHPANLDEVLDPKLTLNDYQITEVYLVAKGTVNLNQAISATDLMVLRKEDERKRMQAKTGGGVLSLIFGKNKSSMGSGSLSSENRSISPSHSDDSRSVTPPAIPQQIITPAKQEPEKPKPPQRKRRPAPKPPTTNDNSRKNSETKPPSNISDNSEGREDKKVDNNLTICHSRNSSDSSGYHEASILSDNCNTSLPRRPQSAFINGADVENLSKQHSQSTTNLSKMSSHSKSTSSLAFPGRKKKAAPPPPPVLKSSTSVTNLVSPSPVVASQAPASIPPSESPSEIQVPIQTPPKPQPRKRTRISSNRSSVKSFNEDELKKIEEQELQIDNDVELRNVNGFKEVEEYKKKSYRNVVDELKTFNRNSRFLESDSTTDDIININIDNVNKIDENNTENTKTEEQTINSDNNDSLDDNADQDLYENIKVDKTNTKVKEIDAKTIKTEILDDIADNDLYEKIIIHDTKNFNVGKTAQQKPNLKASNSLPNMSNIQEDAPTKPPEIVGVIPKTKAKSSYKYDTFGRRSCYKIGSSLLEDNFDSESIYSKMSLDSETSSVRSALNKFKFDDEIDDFNDTLFTGSLSKKSGGSKMFNQLYGMHTHEPVETPKSGNSLRSVDSAPGFDMKKWNNFEELDNISQTSLFDARNNMVTGGSVDTESLPSTNFTQATPLDSLASYLSLNESNSVPETPKPEVQEKTVTTPIEDSYKKEQPKEKINEEPKSEPEEIKIETKKVKEIEEVKKRVVDVVDKVEKPQEKTKETDLEVKEVDWQYQLPPPPEGFRDSTNYADAPTNDVTYRTDSVVTSPELFEKLKVLEDNQSEPGTIASTVSEEDKPLLNNLTLENLEKRKSLVYNRELATSLKMTDSLLPEKADTFSSSLNKFESTYEEIRRSSLTRDYSQDVKLQTTVKRSTSTLPNFKITPYDNPKKNITVFEDDTIRSNTDSALKKSNLNENDNKTNLNRSYVGRSMENISFRKNSWGNQSDDDKSKTRDNNYKFYRPQSSVIPKSTFAASSMYRSESFSTDQHWSPTRPVSRSKSQLTLNKYKEEKTSYKSLEPMTKSNSLLDVSGLQSIGVMKLIQNRLKTPTSSMENVNQQEKLQTKAIKSEISTTEEKLEPIKTYQYRGPPSINLSTWSERPKIPVSVKDDVDYKLNNVSSKLIVNTTNNNITSNNRIEVNNSNKYNSNYASNGSVNVRVGGYQPPESRNVTIKVNGTEPITTENSGNVVIKIGGSNVQNNKPLDSQRFISHTTATGYRKPLGNINKIQTQRPHSMSIDSDLSHVPVVRSVELKKPYKGMNMNTSVTQIYQGNNNFRSNTLSKNYYASQDSYDNKQGIYRSTESLNQTDSKPVSRVNSFANNFAPVVRGFKSDNNTVNNRLSWSPQSTNIYSVNKPKEPESYTTNRDVPFSQSNLRRTESNKRVNSEQNGFNSNEKDFPSKINLINQKNSSYNVYAVNKKSDVIQAPPPPQMPKVEVKKRPRQIEPKEDPRDQLLASIRDFGGKKGLKSVKG